MKIEGPTEIIIPERKYLSCVGCKYYDQHLWKSGIYPIYKYNCLYKENNIILESNITPNNCLLIKK